MMSWLMDEKSLTERLIKGCSKQFRVEVLSQRWVKPTQAEMQLLSLSSRQKVMLRQVILFCGDNPVVFAHSLIPYKTLKGKHRRLAYLKNKPLGKYLFSNVGLKRSSLQWSRILPNSKLYNLVATSGELTGSIWGRRSLFHLGDKKLLVSEYFLPNLLSM